MGSIGAGSASTGRSARVVQVLEKLRKGEDEVGHCFVGKDLREVLKEAAEAAEAAAKREEIAAAKRKVAADEGEDEMEVDEDGMEVDETEVDELEEDELEEDQPEVDELEEDELEEDQLAADGTAASQSGGEDVYEPSKSISFLSWHANNLTSPAVVIVLAKRVAKTADYPYAWVSTPFLHAREVC